MTYSLENSEPSVVVPSTPSTGPTEVPASNSRVERSESPDVEPRLLDKRYIAGFLDGEGSFVIFKVKGISGTTYFNPAIQVSSTDRYVLECLKLTLGGSVSSNGRPGPRARQAWKWRITGRNCTAVIHQVYKHLVVKKQVAKTLASFLKFRERPVHSGSHLICLRYLRRVRALNARGQKFASARRHVPKLATIEDGPYTGRPPASTLKDPRRG